MDLEKRVQELESKINELTKSNISEADFINLFLEVERSKSFDALKDLSADIGRMSLPRLETIVLALATRLRQNTLATEALDEALYNLQEAIRETNTKV